jgi:putative endonuclease
MNTENTGFPAFAGNDEVIVRHIPRTHGLTRQSGNRNNWVMSGAHRYFVYILASKLGGTLYVGVTNNLVRRVFEHKSDAVEGFTEKYRIHHLVYFEHFDDIENAIRREKRIKKWNRNWKVRLIEESNPNWTDLYPNIARQ